THPGFAAGSFWCPSDYCCTWHINCYAESRNKSQKVAMRNETVDFSAVISTVFVPHLLILARAFQFSSPLASMTKTEKPCDSCSGLRQSRCTRSLLAPKALTGRGRCW